MIVKKMVIAPDSFKGTFTADEIIEIIKAKAIVFFPNSQIVTMPVSDGGEGLIGAINKARGGKLFTIEVCDPLMRPVSAKVLEIDKESILLEMAEASGLCLLKADERDPMKTTSYGTGQLINNALNMGYKNIFIGIGGSATNDGGIGMAEALGVKFINDSDVSRGGKVLKHVKSIDLKAINEKIKQANINVICDVNNPLLGENGATKVFARQKGAGESDIAILEEGMHNLAQIVERDIGVKIDSLHGGGAAGGVGAMLTGVLGAKFYQGIEAVLDMLGFDEMISNADLVITGEGRIDSQSTCGKVLSGIGKRCMKKGVCALAVCGILGEGYEGIFDIGIKNIFPAVARFTDYDNMLLTKCKDMESAAERLFRSLTY